MTRDELVRVYYSRWEKAIQDRDTRAVEIYWEIIQELKDEENAIAMLESWAYGKNLRVDKDSWKLYHHFYDELREVEIEEDRRRPFSFDVEDFMNI